MDIGRLLLRGVVGPLFVGHGTQKLFGWFGGHGIEGTGGFFENLGLRPGKRHATAAGWAEAGGGALLTLGAFTPLASLLISSTMVTAIRKVHAPKGPWATERRLRVQPRADRGDGGDHGDRPRPARPVDADAVPRPEGQGARARHASAPPSRGPTW